MVAAARKESKTSEARNDQLRMQLRDTEALLANQQEQLAELKTVMEQMQAREDRDGTNSTAPSSPALQSHPDFRHTIESMQSGPGANQEDITPAPPTSFVHLVLPVLRMDLAAYEDFRTLAEVSRRLAAPSRGSSGPYASGNMPGSLPNFVVSASQVSQSPMQGSVTPSGHPNSPQQSPFLVPLKETRFYKRALVEDIEPTLRLDTAPGLSWLVRRSVISSIVEGSLVVEPMPSATKMFIYPCSLCGETRREENFRRTHRFRTNESDSAQRYPLCTYCLNRLRATCDYISFLRMIKDGHWRTENAETEKAAWEESVRLRERMFWARIGGGVVPAYMHRDSPRPSTEEKPQTPYSAPPQIHNGSHSAKESRGSLPTVERGSALGGIDQRLAHYAAEQKPDERSETEDSAREESSKPSISKEDGSRECSKEPDGQLQFHKASYEKELPPEPRHTDSSPEDSIESNSNASNEQGLQITIPGGYS
jgi:Rab guanine nucleotide exchange factor SEC2